MQNQVIWSWKESNGYTFIKLGQMVFKGVNRVHNYKIRSNGLERSQLDIQCKNQVIWILQGVNWVCTCIKFRSYGLERSQLGTHMIKLGQMVLKGVKWVHNCIKLGQMVLKGVNSVYNAKIRSYGLERS